MKYHVGTIWQKKIILLFSKPAAPVQIDGERPIVIDKRYSIPLCDPPLIYIHSTDTRLLLSHRATNNGCNDNVSLNFEDDGDG